MPILSDGRISSRVSQRKPKDPSCKDVIEEDIGPIFFLPFWSLFPLRRFCINLVAQIYFLGLFCKVVEVRAARAVGETSAKIKHNTHIKHNALRLDIPLLR